MRRERTGEQRSKVFDKPTFYGYSAPGDDLGDAMRPTHAAFVLAATLFCAALLAHPDASAFNRELAQDTAKPLFWETLPVPYIINSQCAGTQEDKTACLDAVQKSFATWTAPDCTVLKFDAQGTTDRTDVGYDQANPGQNINLIVWTFANWPYEAAALALTTTTYMPSTGVIVDADMEVNGQNFEWRALATPDSRYTDIQNVVTHEAGHFIGLDHVNDTASTMYPTAPYGEISKRQLAQDDINGVCAIYPAPGYDGGTGGNSGSGGTTAGGVNDQTPSGSTDDGSGSFNKSGCACTTVEL